MEDFSILELQAADVEAAEETIDEYLESMAQDLGVSEITDLLVRNNSLLYFGEQLESVSAAREYIRGILEETNLRTAVMEKLRDMTEIISFPEEMYHLAQAYAADELAFYALQEGLEADALAILSGCGSAEEYIQLQTEAYVKTAMMIDYILEDREIAWSEEERDLALEDYLKSLGYDAYYTVEEFREVSGETWVWLFTEFDYKGDLMYNALKDDIVLR